MKIKIEIDISTVFNCDTETMDERFQTKTPEQIRTILESEKNENIDLLFDALKCDSAEIKSIKVSEV